MLLLSKKIGRITITLSKADLNFSSRCSCCFKAMKNISSYELYIENTWGSCGNINFCQTCFYHLKNILDEIDSMMKLEIFK